MGDNEPRVQPVRAADVFDLDSDDAQDLFDSEETTEQGLQETEDSATRELNELLKQQRDSAAAVAAGRLIPLLAAGSLITLLTSVEGLQKQQDQKLDADPLKAMETRFTSQLEEARKAVEKIKISDRPGSAEETRIVELEWQDRLVRLVNRLPFGFAGLNESTEPVDLVKVQEKVAKNKLDELTRAELTAAIKLEASENKFGAVSQYAFEKTMKWFNHASLHTYKDLVSSGLRLRPGGPIPSFLGESEVKTEYATAPETFKSKLLSDQTDIAEIKRMADKGLLKTELILDTTAKPGRDQLRMFDNSISWFDDSQDRLVENNHRIEANQRYRVINEILDIKDAGWRPPEHPKELLGYCQRADEVTNLMLRVRNYAEAIKTLEKIDGDFRSKAFSDFPGDLQWDEAAKRVSKMTLQLPDSLAVTANNERKLQRLRDWLDKYGPEVERALEEYRKGDFIRYGDFLEKGSVAVDRDGKTVQVFDDEGKTRVLIKDGKVINRNLDGQLRDGKNILPADTKVEFAKKESFDYICDKFSLSKDPKNGEIIVRTNRSIEKDHVLNYNRWFGTQVGSYENERRYRPEDLVAVQTSSGKVQLIRADRLEEFQTIQGFYHHGAKLATCALDIGMVVSGSVGARAAIQAGRWAYAGINAGRAMLGVTGLMDPAFRQMGETGEAIRNIRHGLILFDVTQGLLRKGIGAATTGKMLFETEGAAAVHKVIEGSKWMSRLESATTKVFGVCDAIYLPILIHETNEKIKIRLGDDPRKLLNAAKDQIGTSRGTDRQTTTKVDTPAAMRAVIDAYGSLLGVKDPVLKEGVEKRLSEIKDSIGDEEKSKATREVLAGFYAPSKEQLLAAKKANSDSIPRIMRDRQLTGTHEDKVAAALGMLFLARDKAGNLPSDGVLARRNVAVAGYEYTIPRGEHVEVVKIQPETITQEINIKDVVSSLYDAALNAPRAQTRLIAADALYRMGAMGSGKYASLALDHLEKEATSTENREFRIKTLRQVCDLIEFTRAIENNPGIMGDARVRLAGENYGASSEQLTRRLQEVAASDQDPDVRAMAMAILHAQNHDKPAEMIEAYYKRYEALKGEPGKFREEFLQGLKAELNTAIIAEGTPKAREEAIERRLKAVQAFRNFEGSKLEADTFKTIDINKCLNDCLKATGLRAIRDRKSDERLNLGLTMRVIDAMMSRKDTLTDDQREDIARTSIGIMEIAYPAGGVGRTDPAAAKLAIIVRMNQIFEGSRLRQDMSDALKRIINLEEPGHGIKTGWGQHPEMRVAAINGLAVLGTTDKAAIDLIADRLKYDTGKTGADAFGEQVPHVRAAAAQALYKLAEHRMRYSEAEIKELEKKDPKVRENLGLDSSLYVDELLKRERDPAALDVLWRVWERKTRIDPESAEYKRMYDIEVDRLHSAAMITFTKDDALAFVTSRQETKLLNPTILEGEVLRRREEVRKDPYSGFWGWCDSWVSSRATIRKKNEQATADAAATAWVEKREQRDEAYAELLNFDKMNADEQAKAIKTLMHIIRHPDQALFKDGDAEHARIRASEMLLRLCQFENNKDIVGNKELLSKVVTTCLLDSSIDTNPQVKFNLCKCIDMLTVADVGKLNQGKATEVWLLTPERASLIYMAAIERETKQKFETKDNLKEKANSRALIMHMLERLYDLRATGAPYRLDALGTNPDFKKYLPDVADAAKNTLSALRYGIVHLQKDAVAAQWNTLSDRADFLESSLSDSKFNYEGACIAMFRACKDKPIETSSDPRAEVLLKALDHPNERVRLAAAVILADSKVDSHFIKATLTLSNLAVNGSKERYQSDAAFILKDVIQRGQPAEQELAYGEWKKSFDARKSLAKQPDSPEPQAPPAIPERDKLAIRKVGEDQLNALIGRGRDRFSQRDYEQLEAMRITHLAAVTGRTEASIRAEITKPLPLPPPIPPEPIRPVVFTRVDTRLCHQPNQNQNGFRLSLHGFDQDLAALADPNRPARKPSKLIDDLLKEKNADGDLGIGESDAAYRQRRLAELETFSRVYPFVTNSFDKGLPQVGRPVWGQVRHRDAAKLDDTKLTERNVGLANTLLEERLKTCKDAAEKIAALRESFDRTPVSTGNDKRIGKVVNLLNDRDEAVRLEAATIILRGSKENFFHKGFSQTHRAQAYDALSRSVDTLLNRGVKDKDPAYLTLLDRALEAPDNGVTMSAVGQYVMGRQDNWTEAGKLMAKHLGENRFTEQLKDGTTREARKVNDSVLFSERKSGELTRCVAPDGVKYADVLTADLKKAAPQGKLELARTLLTNKIEIGTDNTHRAAAMDELAALALDNTTPTPLRIAAITLAFQFKPNASAGQLEKVSSACVSLSCDGDQKTAARSLLGNIDKASATACATRLATEISQRETSDDAAKSRIEVLALIGDNWRKEPVVEAAAYSAWMRASNLSDEKLLGALRRMVDRTGERGRELAAIAGKGDPRLRAMINVLTSTNKDEMALHAALALIDKTAKDVEPRITEEARKHVFHLVKGKIEELRNDETKPDADKSMLLERWELIDRMLEQLGQTADDYSRLYIQSKRLESKQDHKSLATVYNQLAQISEDRDSVEAANLYRMKAKDAGQRSEGTDTPIGKARQRFEAASQNSNQTIAGGDPTKLPAISRDLQAALKDIADTCGMDSVITADVYLAAADIYKRAGLMAEAELALTRATAILQTRALNQVGHLQRAFGGAVAESKVPVARRLARGPEGVGGTTVTLSNDETLTNMLDYQLSKDVVDEGARSDARKNTERLLRNTETIFGKESPQAARGQEQVGDVLAASGNNIDAAKHYQSALDKTQMLMNPIDGERQGQLAQKLAKNLMWQSPQGFQQAVQVFEGSLQKMRNSGVANEIIAEQMRMMAIEFRNRGDVGKAADLEGRASGLENTGNLAPPSPTHLYPPGYGGYQGMPRPVGAAGGPTG